MKRKRVAVLISGRGSNLQALIDAARAPDYPAEIGLVVSNRPGAYGLTRAEGAGIATLVIDHRRFADRQGFEAALDAALTGDGAELVCLAGFMRLLTEWFVRRWQNRLINIHPALLPAFRGLHAHERAIAAGVRIAGCTVHFVRAEMDAGPIIVQAAVPVLPGDDADALAARVLTVEHRAFPLALALVASGRARVVAERVEIAGGAVGEGALINPAALAEPACGSG